MTDCVFCAEIERPCSIKSLISIPYSDRIIYSDDYVLAFPGLGPQVFPYILVVTKRHIVSLTQADCNERIAVLNCLHYLSKSGLYADDCLTVFEHGGDLSVGCSSIEHCHLHVVASSLNIKHHLKWYHNASQIAIDSTGSFEDKGGYLLIADYENDEMNGRVHSPDIIESQYFRKVISRIKNDTDWDWRVINNDDYIIRALEFYKD